MVCKVSRNVNVEVIIESLKNSSYIRFTDKSPLPQSSLNLCFYVYAMHFSKP